MTEAGGPSAAGTAAFAAEAQTALARARSALGLSRASRQAYCLTAILVLGLGCAPQGGGYAPIGLGLIVVAAALILCLPLGHTAPASDLPWVAAVGGGALATGVVTLGPATTWLEVLGLGALALVVLLCRRSLIRRLAAVLGAGLWLCLVLTSIGWGGVPFDVVELLKGSTAQLLAGANPYAALYLSSTPGVAGLHLPYWPGALIFSIPGSLAGDVRLSDMLAMAALVAALVTLARRHGGDELGWRCFALCLSLPFLPYMVELAWVEVYLGAAIALWLCWREGHPRWGVATLGLAMATVPTPLPLLLIPFVWWRRVRVELLAAAFLAALVCLPFIFWAGLQHFLYDTVGVQLQLPARPTGLDFTSLWLRSGWGPPPVWLWPLVAAITAMLVLRRRERTWAMAFFSGAGLLVVALLFAKWAFFDYYFLVAEAMLLGLVLGPQAEPERSPKSQRPGGVTAADAAEPTPRDIRPWRPRASPARGSASGAVPGPITVSAPDRGRHRAGSPAT